MALSVSHENPVLRDTVLQWTAAQPEVETLIDVQSVVQSGNSSLICV